MLVAESRGGGKKPRQPIEEYHANMELMASESSALEDLSMKIHTTFATTWTLWESSRDL
jgi:hypothetical protein